MGERVCAAIVLKPGEDLTLDDLKRHLKSLRVAKFKWPEYLVRLDGLAKNPLGKIVRAELRANVLDALAAQELRE